MRYTLCKIVTLLLLALTFKFTFQIYIDLFYSALFAHYFVQIFLSRRKAHLWRSWRSLLLFSPLLLLPWVDPRVLIIGYFIIAGCHYVSTEAFEVPWSAAGQTQSVIFGYFLGTLLSYLYFLDFNPFVQVADQGFRVVLQYLALGCFLATLGGAAGLPRGFHMPSLDFFLFTVCNIGMLFLLKPGSLRFDELTFYHVLWWFVFPLLKKSTSVSAVHQWKSRGKIVASTVVFTAAIYLLKPPFDPAIPLEENRLFIASLLLGYFHFVNSFLLSGNNPKLPLIRSEVIFVRAPSP